MLEDMRSLILIIAKVTFPFLLCFLPTHLFAEGHNIEQKVKWDKYADDIDVARVSVWQQSVISPELLLIRSSLNRYRLGVIRAADYGLLHANVRALSKKAKSIMAINANFFDEHGKALGLVISRGIKHQKMHSSGGTLTGVFQVSQNGISIINRANFNPHLVIEAVQAGPRLLVNGLPVKQIKEADTYSRRAGVCLDKNNNVIFFISSGLMGISFHQVQDILNSHGIDCVNALNFDGGGSAQFYLTNKLDLLQNKNLQEIFIQGRDNIPVAIGLFKKDIQ